MAFDANGTPSVRRASRCRTTDLVYYAGTMTDSRTLSAAAVILVLFSGLGMVISAATGHGLAALVFLIAWLAALAAFSANLRAALKQHDDRETNDPAR